MVTCHIIVQLLPELFDVIDPRLIGVLEQQLKLGVVTQPSGRQSAFMDAVVINDEDNLARGAVSPT
jgi:hypothetical protein